MWQVFSVVKKKKHDSLYSKRYLVLSINQRILQARVLLFSPIAWPLVDQRNERARRMGKAGTLFSSVDDWGARFLAYHIVYSLNFAHYLVLSNRTCVQSLRARSVGEPLALWSIWNLDLTVPPVITMFHPVVVSGFSNNLQVTTAYWCAPAVIMVSNKERGFPVGLPNQQHHHFIMFGIENNRVTQ